MGMAAREVCALASADIDGMSALTAARLLINVIGIIARVADFRDRAT